jgi:aryl-alcohol dehydrogenase-like predicted oxidoreductase
MDKLVLGTVQFGLKYGINNKLGKPSLKRSLSILKYAYDSGISTFDTAFAYGDAEEILGYFFTKYKINKKVSVISKFRANILDDKTLDTKYSILKWEIEKSLKKLNLDSLDGYLFHTPSYIYDNELVEAMRKCKEEGLTKNFGVSVYEEADALYAVNKAKVDYIQIPYSIFDQRLEKTDFFNIAKKNKVKVFARSAFLQGLILMNKDEIPDYLSVTKDYLETFDSIITKYNYSRVEAALLFSLCNKGIDEVVFGVDTLEQLKQDCSIAKMDKDKFRDCLNELRNNFVKIEKSIIFPSLWKKE